MINCTVTQLISSLTDLASIDTSFTPVIINEELYWSCHLIRVLHSWGQNHASHIMSGRFYNVLHLVLHSFKLLSSVKSMDKSQITYSFYSWWTYGLFPLLAIISKATMSNLVHDIWWTWTPFSLGYTHRNEIVGS